MASRNKSSSSLLVLLVFFVLLLAAPGTWSARSRNADKQNSLRRAASSVYQGMSGLFGEENVRALQKFFSRLMEQIVHGADTFWNIWADLLDMLGIHGSNFIHYFSPESLANGPIRALLLIGVIFCGYWFVSIFTGFIIYVFHVFCGRFFWIIRFAVFVLFCLYILQRYEGELEDVVLPLCFVTAIYFMAIPSRLYWRQSTYSSLEEKIDCLDSQIRLLNVHLSRVIENMDRKSYQ